MNIGRKLQMVPNVKSQNNRKKVRKIVMMHICVFAGLVLLMGTVWHCPVQLLFGVPCPGCGTTRACLSLLSLDIRGALSYQPVFLLNIFLFWYCIHRNIIRRNWIERGRRWNERLETAGLVLLIGIILVVYVARLISQDSPVMELHPEQGLVFRGVEILRGMM